MRDFDSRFEEVMEAIDQAGKCLGQDRIEWREFLRFAAAYFQGHGIAHPVVVEIGTLDGAQKRFYEALLGAEHIGISLPQNSSAAADIVGDSTAPETVTALRERLAGRNIDLLFIDGNHSLQYAKADYVNYGRMTAHLIALHDLFCDDGTPDMDSGKLWQEIKASEAAKAWTFLTLHHPRAHEETTIWPGHEMGIGVIIKGGRP